MMNKFGYWILVFFGLFFFISCGGDDSNTFEDDSNAFEDDSNTFPSQLQGQWQIVAINVSDSSMGPVLEPEEGEIITITFNSNGDFFGETSFNLFSGKSTAGNYNLFIQGLESTQALDTIFGQAFYQAILENGDEMEQISEYSIVFINDNKVNLVYDEFKFISLERVD